MNEKVTESVVTIPTNIFYKQLLLNKKERKFFKKYAKRAWEESNGDYPKAESVLTDIIKDEMNARLVAIDDNDELLRLLACYAIDQIDFETISDTLLALLDGVEYVQES